eukprot:TRINITY_DN1808_c0_g1_i1.p1 TRINITY_DN1808_c0_g1~~TRINITY_DN1808_c0_g1_i1.p1  ORF type:complete len:165 (-),score=41.79 TRINITY_DN1808_c0_g1_i1:27-521(-)
MKSCITKLENKCPANKKEEDHREKQNELIRADQQNTRLVIKVQKQLEDSQRNEDNMQNQLDEKEERIGNLVEQLELKNKQLDQLEQLQIDNEVLVSSNRSLSATVKKLESEIEILKQRQKEKAENNVMVEAIQQELDTANETISSLKDELKNKKKKYRLAWPLV